MTRHTTKEGRKMPPKLDLGNHMASTVGAAILNRESGPEREPGFRYVMGYKLPTWQRPFVWTTEQKIRLLESLWLGINVGTYTFNRTTRQGPLDNLLIDGQQRMKAIEEYLDDEFSVFGWKYSDLGPAERRRFAYSTHFHCFITASEDEDYLRSYYNMMNFGGTAHEERDRA